MEAETASASAEQALALMSAGRKKRKLYRQVTGSEVPWFPHDNDSELLKELCHEAGRPRWVYFGTPAGGAGIHGYIEIGCSVMALCYDVHHMTHLGPFLVQRAVEAMLGSTSMVFNNDALVSRGKQLRLADTKDSKNGHKQDKKEDKKDEEEEEEEKKVKKKGGKAKAKRKQSSSSEPSDESSESTDETEEKEEKTPPTKKRKKKA